MDNKVITAKEDLKDIVYWYLSDLIKYVDFTLTDLKKPQKYSAKTAEYGIEMYIRYRRLHDPSYTISTIGEFILDEGYPIEDVELFYNKLAHEYKNVGYKKTESKDNDLNGIIQWYLARTLELIDLVLADDLKDPQYSAVTTTKRIKLYVHYKRATDQNYAISTVDEFMVDAGYTLDEAKWLEKLRIEELNEIEAWKREDAAKKAKDN